ncbi:hypothetical protein GPU89_37720 [Burkholderia cepacia]|nr:hypothetical protein [Burkholderia cepacia]
MSLDRIRVALGRIRARVSSCIPAANRKPIGFQSSSDLVEDPSGADVVLAATISAVRAEASVSELESLEVRHARLPTAHFPGTRAHVDLIGSRVRKAQFHAARARAHANAAVLIFMGGTEDHLGSPLEDLKRHAEQAKQAQVLASDLLEISLTLERRKNLVPRDADEDTFQGTASRSQERKRVLFRCMKRPREGMPVSVAGTENGAGNIRCAAMVVFATIVMKWLH